MHSCSFAPNTVSNETIPLCGLKRSGLTGQAARVLCVYVPLCVPVGALAAVYVAADMFCVEGAVPSVEARHKGFETWDDACHDRGV